MIKTKGGLKWKISRRTTFYNTETRQMEKVNFDDYDLIYERTAGYAHEEYTILKNETDL